jgi:hypothetical protein
LGVFEGLVEHDLFAVDVENHRPGPASLGMFVAKKRSFPEVPGTVTGFPIPVMPPQSPGARSNCGKAEYLFPSGEGRSVERRGRQNFRSRLCKT